MSVKPLIIYHKNCDDGFGAAYAAWTKLGDAADYLAMDYADDPAAAPVDGRDVIVVDFSFSPADADKHILPRARSLVILDHHRSAADDWKIHLGQPANDSVLRHQDGKLDLLFDMDKSGAYLAWEYFHPGTKVPDMIACISDVDLWTWKLPGSKAFSSYLRSQPRDLAEWAVLHARMEADPAAILATGTQINGFYEQQLTSILSTKREASLDMTAMVEGNPVTTRGLAINASKVFSSELGNMLASRCGTFGIVWETDGKTAYCSARSVMGFDFIPYATAQGGGGHPQACGFIIPLEKLLAALRGETSL